jgi:hypothetical protein
MLTVFWDISQYFNQSASTWCGHWNVTFSMALQFGSLVKSKFSRPGLFKRNKKGMTYVINIFYWILGVGHWGLISGALLLEPLHQSSFCVGYYQGRVSQSICQGWLWTSILLASASWVARITGVSHWHPITTFCLYTFCPTEVQPCLGAPGWIPGLAEVKNLGDCTQVTSLFRALVSHL